VRGLGSLGDVGQGAIAFEVRVRVVLLETACRGVPREFLQVCMRIIAMRLCQLGKTSI